MFSQKRKTRRNRIAGERLESRNLMTSLGFATPAPPIEHAAAAEFGEFARDNSEVDSKDQQGQASASQGGGSTYTVWRSSDPNNEDSLATPNEAQQAAVLRKPLAIML